jgi:polysaccharide export outer membrane protein
MHKDKRKLSKPDKTIVIEIDYNRLVRGQSSLNIVIRPGDAIYCDSGEVGVVYIDGEISRPGVYNLPTNGRLTLSRLVAAAGGVSELAIPERCDLIRRIGSDKEACVRISLAAIRNRGEPDIFLKPDDHLIVGTNFWALPLARFRRDLSFPNSVGFQLDRNFGNDVFGAPPSGITTN